MRKRTRRALSLLLALMLCISAFGVLASARASNQIAAYDAYCTAGSGGKVSVTVKVTGVGTMDTIGTTKIIIYESTNGGTTYSAVKTYYSASVPAMLKSNVMTYNATPVAYSGTAGYKYKAMVTCYAEDSEGSDSKVKSTAAVTAIS